MLECSVSEVVQSVQDQIALADHNQTPLVVWCMINEVTDGALREI